MGPPQGSIPDMDERRASGETNDAPLRLLYLALKIHSESVDFQPVIRYTVEWIT